MLTAAEARKLSKPERTLLRDSATLEKLIVQAAKTGETSIRVPYEMCEFDGYSAKFIVEGLQQHLEKCGYVITTEECHQFVDFWIKVSW